MFFVNRISLVFTVVFVFVLGTNAECPNIIKKSKWGGRINKDVDYLIIPVKNAIIAHTATQECDTENGCSDLVMSIQSYHMDSLNFHDIGYNFLIGGDGNVYEGTGWNRVGAHTQGWNVKSIGIAFIGDFSNKLPTANALEAAKNLLACGVEMGKLDTRYKLYGHRQLISTMSPGTTLYKEITDWPNFASA